MENTILLFDMDGVLLHADGYHRALQSAVELIGRNLGIEEPILSKEHIAHFEAAGVTHEWETLAISTAILLVQVWQHADDIRLPELIDPAPERFLIKGKDQFWGFLKGLDLQGAAPTVYAAAFLHERNPELTADQQDYLELVLGSGLEIERSPTLRVFQELVLGSAQYTQVYDLPPRLDTDSYLALFDRKVLSEKNRQGLMEWLQTDSCRAAIFTNRPSRPPEGHLSTPEAELGAKAIELQDLPIIGAGSLSWLARSDAKPLDAYYKPSPVHTLAALQAAGGLPLSQSLRIAADLYHGRWEREAWLPLLGSKVFVFEDLTPGLVSARQAKEVLDSIHIQVEFTAVGISKHPRKQAALAQWADHVIEDLNEEILPGIIF